MSRPKILYLVSEDWYFCSHRLPVARAARDMGFEVVVLTRLNHHIDPIRAEGFRPIPLRLERGSRSPLSGLVTAAHIARIYRRERPHLVHHVNIKMCLLGSLAARLAAVSGWHPRVVNGITGMGHLFVGEARHKRGLQSAVLAILRALSATLDTRLIVQNRDDFALATAWRIVSPERMTIIPGSGVDVRQFRPQGETTSHTPGVTSTDPPLVTYVGRMLAVKGVYELVAAGRILKARGRRVRIALVGPVDRENPDSLREEELRRWHDEGIVEWWGYRSDIAAVWAASAVAVLPTYYREGIPKSLLEAGACGLPLIATDVAGCRDLVVPEQNGLLVPPHDPEALAKAIDRLLMSAELRVRLGRNARRFVEATFSEDVVATATAELYRSLLAPLGTNHLEATDQFHGSADRVRQ